MKWNSARVLNGLWRIALLIAVACALPAASRLRSSSFPPIVQTGMAAQHAAGELRAEGLQTVREPAAVYCTELGYKYSIVREPDGRQHGLCTLPDRTTCDGWAFLAGRCGEQYNACAQHGLDTVTRPDGDNPFASESAFCVDAVGEVQTSAADLVNLVEASIDSRSTMPSPQAMMPVKEVPDASPRDAALPFSFDWRDHDGANWLTPVRNQGQCGSCWSFAAAGVAEAVTNIGLQDHTVDLDLSEQYLVTDCASDAGDCAGGSKYSALRFIRDNGIPDEGCLPYQDGGSTGCTYASGSCDCAQCTYCSSSECSDCRCSDRCSDWTSRLASLEVVHSMYGASRTEIKEALVTHGPLAVSLYMRGSFDANDVYRCSSAPSTNHAVVIVGYDDAGEYWIVRNSWGSSWNGDGYFKVAYDNCLIEHYPVYADLVVVCNDLYEPNDSTSAATPILNKQTIEADICADGDRDVYAFTHNEGTRVAIDIDARDAGSDLDSYVYLLDSDGTTVLAENDDANSSLDSYLEYTLPHDGTYYIEVRDYGGEGGVEYGYSIELSLTARQDFAYGVSVTQPDGDKAAEMGFNWIKVYNPPSAPQPTNVLYRAPVDAADADDLEALYRRMRGLAQAYGAYIDAYEIGNELNTGYEWGAAPEAARYVDVLCTARRAILEVDPTAKIVSAGLAPVGRVANSWNGHAGHDGEVQDEREYLREFLDHGGERCIEALGYHPMGFSADYDAEPEVDGGTSETNCTDGLCFRGASAIHQILTDRGLGDLQMWATEVGWITAPPEACLSDPSWEGREWQIVSAEKQAENLIGAFTYARLHWPWLEAMFVFNLDFNAAPYYEDCEQMRYYSLLGTPAEPALTEMPKELPRIYLPLVLK